MIKKFSEFIREFVESGSYIDSKMQEIRDLINSVSSGQNLIYEWENIDDHNLNVSFSFDGLSIKYEFDIDDLYLTKYAGDVVDFQTDVESIDEGLEMIEKDIHQLLGISENHKGEWSSSIDYLEAETIVDKICKFQKINVMDNTADPEGLVKSLEKSLHRFDKETIDLVIDTLLFGDGSESWREWGVKEIISVGDKIMSKYGTEPMQVLNAYDVALAEVSKHFDWEDYLE